MLHTNPEFIYELKIGIAALQRACYEVIEACVKMHYALRLLDKDTGGASSGKHDSETQQPNKDGFYGTIVDDGTRIDPRSVLPTFTPTTKPHTTKGDPLAELAAQLSPQDREKLISSLEGGKK